MRRILLLLMMMPTLVIAQDATPEATSSAQGWRVIERCVGEATPPPDGWTYEGTIFTLDFGIKAYNTNFDTSYFIMFDDSFYDSASLSPDGKWYAVPMGYTDYATLSERYYIVESIEVYSTDGRRETHQIPWSREERGGISAVIGRIKWINTNEFAFWWSESAYHTPEIRIANPFSGEIVSTHEKDSLNPMAAEYSPDGTRAIYNADVGNDEQSLPDWGLYDLTIKERIATLGGGYPSNFSIPYDFEYDNEVIWSGNSAYFYGFRHFYENASSIIPSDSLLVLYDRNGIEITNFPYNIDYYTTRHVAPSGSYIALYSPYGRDRFLYLADIANHHIINTCIPLDGEGGAWSPSGRQIALRSEGDLVIYELEEDVLYTIAIDAGAVTAWGESQ